jgi:hypothetical protein
LNIAFSRWHKCAKLRLKVIPQFKIPANTHL